MKTKNTLVISQVLGAERKPDGTVRYNCDAHLNGEHLPDTWHVITGVHPDADAICEAYNGVIQDVEDATDASAQSLQKRVERNQLLKDSDWVMLPDSGLTDEQKSTWATYRQSLRDITEVDGFPDVEFPTKP